MSRVTTMAKDVQQIKEVQVERGTRLDRLDGQMSVVTATLREHSPDIKELKADMKDVKAYLKEVQQIVAGHAKAITELQAR